VFLKSTKGREDWQVAGFGNCYFWSHDPDNLDSLRAMASAALKLRKAWNDARDNVDVNRRVEALWPFLSDYNGSCRSQTMAELKLAGYVAGDFIADRLKTLTHEQKMMFLPGAGDYRSDRLHSVLIDELNAKKSEWEELLNRLSRFRTYDDFVKSYEGKPLDSDGKQASEISGELYYGLAGLAKFNNANDLQFIRDLALWGVKNRFKQLDEAAIGAFGQMPDRLNLPVIATIWREYPRTPPGIAGLQPYDFIRALRTHRFPEAIPLMAEFVGSGFEQEVAQEFLRDLTGVNLGDSTERWLTWYRSHYR
jgi:hypothetical protein